MKVTFKLDTGTEVTVGAENIVIQAVINEKKEPVVTVGYRVDATHSIPVLFFAGHYFNDAAMAAHDKEVRDAAKKPAKPAAIPTK